MMNDRIDTMDSNLQLTETCKTRTAQIKEKPRSITPLTIDDIDSVVSLSRKYFPRSKEYSIDILKKRTTELYFKNGELLPDVAPLVSRSKNGNVNGFLGAITKTFSYRNRMITMANCHHLMATEEARKQLVPLKLLQHFLAGPQDVSFSDGSTDSTRQIWKRLGGEAVTGESIYYKVPLRPVSFSFSHLLKQNQNPVADAIQFIASSADSIAGSLHLPYFQRKKPAINFASLDTEMMSALLKKIKPYYSLFPQYEISDIERLFQLLNDETRFGTLHKVALLDQDDHPIGWFIYFAQKKGVCEVIQAVSVPGKESELFNALTWHAFSKGGMELSGRLMPSQLQTPFTTKAISMPARMWTLIHSNDIELKYAIQSGKAFMTRLEGDLWVL